MYCQVIDGVYMGGIAAALEGVEENELSPENFKFFAG